MIIVVYFNGSCVKGRGFQLYDDTRRISNCYTRIMRETEFPQIRGKCERYGFEDLTLEDDFEEFFIANAFMLGHHDEFALSQIFFDLRCDNRSVYYYKNNESTNIIATRIRKPLICTAFSCFFLKNNSDPNQPYTVEGLGECSATKFKGIVCKRRVNITQAEIFPTMEELGSCRKTGRLVYDSAAQQYYCYLSMKAKTFKQSEEYCKNVGGIVATFNTKKEEHYIKKFLISNNGVYLVPIGCTVQNGKMILADKTSPDSLIARMNESDVRVQNGYCYYKRLQYTLGFLAFDNYFQAPCLAEYVRLTNVVCRIEGDAILDDEGEFEMESYFAPPVLHFGFGILFVSLLLSYCIVKTKPQPKPEEFHGYDTPPIYERPRRRAKPSKKDEVIYDEVGTPARPAGNRAKAEGKQFKEISVGTLPVFIRNILVASTFTLS
uniref:C-type lectin domain-containing protein n=1 Tax=Syphacia muris TaxID=451379 RepID=A0A0N5AXB9_9BILA